MVILAARGLAGLSFGWTTIYVFCLYTALRRKTLDQPEGRPLHLLQWSLLGMQSQLN